MQNMHLILLIHCSRSSCQSARLIQLPVPCTASPVYASCIVSRFRGLDWSALKGLVRSIGVSNFSVRKLEAILSYAQIPPAVCQVWLTIQLDNLM